MEGNAGTTVTLTFDDTVTIGSVWHDGGITGGSGSKGTTVFKLTGDDGKSAKSTSVSEQCTGGFATAACTAQQKTSR